METNYLNLSYNEKIALIKTGNNEILDALVRDEDWEIRKAVAEFGRPKDLDVLVTDADWHVRYAVARQGREKDLNVLANDKEADVREAVAKYRSTHNDEKKQENKEL